jgi:hypothetical protein
MYTALDKEEHMSSSWLGLRTEPTLKNKLTKKIAYLI